MKLKLGILDQSPVTMGGTHLLHWKTVSILLYWLKKQAFIVSCIPNIME
jgi:hypothetical protein